ncbi:uncharacterized protein [Epargyreus clarus]|uniref:uncharacterized protein n=1 Tax=Epargyreus clarus TaxID=520877 RepID=UPI003C2E5E6B
MLSRGKKLVLLTRPTSPTESIESIESSVPPSHINQDGSSSLLPTLRSPSSNAVFDNNRPTSPIERNEPIKTSVPPPINQAGSSSLLPTLNSPSNSTVIDETSTEEQESGYPTGDFSGTDSGDDFKPSSSSCSSSNSSSSSSSSSSDSSSENEAVDDQEPTSPPKNKGRKRTRNPHSWKKNIAKKLRNSGNEYRSLKTGKTVQARKIGPCCSEKCRLACSSNFSQEKRIEIFNSYWGLGSVERHRDFLNSCIRPLEIASRRIKTYRRYPRQGNSAFYLLNDGNSVWVCKTFLINTLGISPRTIRTVIDAKN